MLKRGTDFFGDKLNLIAGSLTVIVEMANSLESEGLVRRAQGEWENSMLNYLRTNDFLEAPKDIQEKILEIINKSNGYDWWTERDGQFRELAILTLRKYEEFYPDQKIETGDLSNEYKKYLRLT